VTDVRRTQGTLDFSIFLRTSCQVFDMTICDLIHNAVFISFDKMSVEGLSRLELLLLCKEKGLCRYSKLRKGELVTLLESTSAVPSSTSAVPSSTSAVPSSTSAVPSSTSAVPSSTSVVPSSTIRYIDLFCGLGAFHLAFNDSKRLQCVFACDINDGVRKIYKANHGLEPAGDIQKITPATIPDFDILCAGFPCQPFSIAGDGKGFDDEAKGNLFYEILKIIDSKHPPLCILENVKNLASHDNGNTYTKIRTSLEARGYMVTSKILNACHYGSPQARERIFIVASRRKFTIPDLLLPLNPVSTIIDHMNTGVWDYSAYTLQGKTGKVRPYKPHILYDVVSKKTGKGGRQGERVYSIDSVGITVCASSGGPGAKTGLYQIGDVIRRLNLVEVLGMFGFPLTYKFPGVQVEQSIFYLGNSIVVDVVKSFVEPIEEYFNTP
jgi:DNA (cytosine-5)-methyltransferase 1